MADANNIRLIDADKRPVTINRGQFLRKLKLKPEEERWKLVDYIEEAIAFPDEIIMSQNTQNDAYVLKYIKHFQQHPYVVVCELGDGGYEIKSWYVMNRLALVDNQRAGLVIKTSGISTVDPSPVWGNTNL